MSGVLRSLHEKYHIPSSRIGNLVIPGAGPGASLIRTQPRCLMERRASVGLCMRSAGFGCTPFHYYCKKMASGRSLLNLKKPLSHLLHLVQHLFISPLKLPKSLLFLWEPLLNLWNGRPKRFTSWNKLQAKDFQNIRMHSYKERPQGHVLAKVPRAGTTEALQSIYALGSMHGVAAGPWDS